MSKRAEEAAMKAYPVKGYFQAEQDLALTWEDMRTVLELCSEAIQKRYRFKEGFYIPEQPWFFQEVLEQFKEQRK